MIQPAKSICFLLFCLLLISIQSGAQETTPVFTHADTLRGSMNPEREYNVLKYEITVTPDYNNKSIVGINKITYVDPVYTDPKKVPDIKSAGVLQIDLQEPLVIDSILQDDQKLEFKREGNAFHVNTFNEASRRHRELQSCLPCTRELIIYYHGNPQIAVRPP